MAWKHEQYALSVLPQNFQTGDILLKSCLETLEQEGLSMFQLLATVFEPEGKDRAPDQEASVIQKARAMVRVACMQVKKQQLELDMEQQNRLVPNRKGIHQDSILLPCLFNLYAEYIMKNTGLDEAQSGIKISGRNINSLRYADDTTLMAENEEPLDEAERGEGKGLLKGHHSKNENCDIWSHHFMANKWKKK